MIQTTTPEQKPNLAELVLSMAMSGKSWDEFTDSVIDKVASKLAGIIPDKREVEPCAQEYLDVFLTMSTRKIGSFN